LVFTKLTPVSEAGNVIFFFLTGLAFLDYISEERGMHSFKAEGTVTKLICGSFVSVFAALAKKVGIGRSLLYL